MSRLLLQFGINDWDILLFPSCLAKSTELHGTASSHFCVPCQLGKSSSLPFVASESSSTRPLELIHSDVWGPAPIMSVTGFKNHVMFFDDFTRYTWLFPIQCKSEVFSVFLSFKLQVENMLSLKIQCFRSDGGGEYVNHKFKKLFNDCGIIHQLVCPYTPKQNGCTECKHRHVVENSLTLLLNASMPLHYWADAFSIATYLINRMSMRSMQFTSPWQQFFGSTPNYMSLKVFGYACYQGSNIYIT